MKDFKKIVVGVDLDVHGTKITQGSARAIAQAEWLAAKNGGEVQLVHSTRTDRYIEPHQGHWVIVHEGLSAAGEHALESAATRLREAEIECTLTVREDRPFLAICRTAIESGADLVILGKHEDVGEETKIGRVASNVLRNCPAPVWVVKPEASLAPKLVLAATDLTEVGARAVAHAAFVADSFSASLHIAHAFQIEMAAQMAGAYEGSDEMLAAARKKATSEVEEQVTRSECSTVPQLHVACNSPSHEILQLDAQLHPDLVVMGMVSREGIPGLILGNTAERVLGRLRSSLLAIKPASFVSPIASE